MYWTLLASSVPSWTSYTIPVHNTSALLLQVLLRALRDFNLGKLTADDTGIFTGLLDDLFPKVSAQVPRARDIPFEAKVSAHASAYMSERHCS